MTASAKTEQSPNVVKTDFFSPSKNKKDPHEMLRDLMELIEATKKATETQGAAIETAAIENDPHQKDVSISPSDPDTFIVGVLDHMLASLEQYRERKRSYGG